MRNLRPLFLFGAALILAACESRPSIPTAPLKADSKVANGCAWYRSGDSDSTLVCDGPTLRADSVTR